MKKLFIILLLLQCSLQAGAAFPIYSRSTVVAIQHATGKISDTKPGKFRRNDEIYSVLSFGFAISAIVLFLASGGTAISWANLLIVFLLGLLALISGQLAFAHHSKLKALAAIGTCLGLGIMIGCGIGAIYKRMSEW